MSLCSAVESMDYDLVGILQKAGDSASIQDYNGTFGCSCAVDAVMNHDVVKILLEAGTNPIIEDCNGTVSVLSPSFWKSRNNNDCKQMIRLLLPYV